MAPFPMKCLSCGEYIGKGRTFNSRKETWRGESYFGIQIFHFSIKCTRCSAPIVFRTDPKNAEYAMVSGAVRNAEPWRDAAEMDEQRLDRLEAEGQQEKEEGVHDALQNLEHRVHDGETEMAVAEALGQIQLQNAVRARASMQERDATVDEGREVQERQDSEEARMAFAKHRSGLVLAAPVEQKHDKAPPSLMKPSTRPTKKQKKDYAAALGINPKKT